MVLDLLDFGFAFFCFEYSSYPPSLNDGLQLCHSFFTESVSYWKVQLPGSVSPIDLLNLNGTVVDVVVKHR